jgi:hypothetical protein
LIRLFAGFVGGGLVGIVLNWVWLYCGF